MQVAHILISGFVQGVGYRQFVKRKAREFGLTGFVRNLPDGKVEAIFQGSKENIEKMIVFCKKGPFLSEIKEVQAAWEESKESFETFEVIT